MRNYDDLGDQIQKDGRDMSCCTYKDKTAECRALAEEHEEGDHLEDLGEEGRKILKWIIKK